MSPPPVRAPLATIRKICKAYKGNVRCGDVFLEWKPGKFWNYDSIGITYHLDDGRQFIGVRDVSKAPKAKPPAKRKLTGHLWMVQEKDTREFFSTKKAAREWWCDGEKIIKVKWKQI